MIKNSSNYDKKKIINYFKDKKYSKITKLSKFLRSWLNYFLTHKNYPKVMRKNELWVRQNEPLIFGK